MVDPLHLYLEMQKWCTVIMLTISLLTLAKVIKSTYKSPREFLLIYTVVGLSVFSWTLIALTYFIYAPAFYSFSLSYTAC